MPPQHLTAHVHFDVRITCGDAVQFSGCKWEWVLLPVSVGTAAAGGLPLCLHCWGVMLRNFQDYKTLALVHLGRKEPVIRS